VICDRAAKQSFARVRSIPARKLISAALAFPSTAGARSLILIAPPCSPTTLLIFAFGTT